MDIKWVLPHYSLPLEVEGVEELKAMGLVCMYMGRDISGPDQGDCGPLHIFIQTKRANDSGILDDHLFGIEVRCHRVYCGEDSDPPKYCEKHKKSIEEIINGCGCCSQCCSCGG